MVDASFDERLSGEVGTLHRVNAATAEGGRSSVDQRTQLVGPKRYRT
jgi:hypothetical protein